MADSVHKVRNKENAWLGIETVYLVIGLSPLCESADKQEECYIVRQIAKNTAFCIATLFSVDQTSPFCSDPISSELYSTYYKIQLLSKLLKIFSAK